MEPGIRLLRDYARNHNLRLADLAQAFIDGTEPLTGHAAARAAAAARRAGTARAPARLVAQAVTGKRHALAPARTG